MTRRATGASALLALGWTLVAAGCHAPPSRLAAGQTLHYAVSHISGDVSLKIAKDGRADVVRVVNGKARSHQGQVTPERLEQLIAGMREHSCCSLTSGRSRGVPDEAHPSFAVRTAGLDCRVGMWDNEIRDDSDAKACFDVVEHLVEEIFPAAHP